jgi:phage repressor protein C with HTH and peptisase S24 domain
MEPHIVDSSSVLVSIIPFLFKSPKVSDIVVFKDKNGKILIKRIAGKEGDEYFVRGDNKSDSLDSRKLGNISRKQIIGKVIYKL